MKNNNCSDCSEKTVEGRAVIDKETGLLCVDLNCQDYKTDKDILIPYVCTTCGETTWKTKSPTECGETTWKTKSPTEQKK